ncbi:MAG: hypothetical protein JXR97_05590 [Planctomycetes bacterium]|nr:hypothetical protein [Pontiellaceae bacterium]MBN2711896.1 hypothetical protein [Planctomycetota bacterium]
MKKLLAVLALVLVAGASFAQTSTNAIVFTNQTLTIEPRFLDVDSLEFGDTQVNGEMAKMWTISATFMLPYNYVYTLGGHECLIQSFRCIITITATEAELQAAVGDKYDAVKFAVTNGLYQPSGEVKASLLSVVAAKLSQPQ